MSDLIILSLNCNSLVSNAKRLNLQNYLSRYNPHIALLQETRLRQCHRPRISGYTLVYLPLGDRSTQSTPHNVGTAVAVKNGIQHSVVHFSLTIGFCTFVEVMDGGRKILIGSLYLHPGTPAVDTESALAQIEGLTSNKRHRRDSLMRGSTGTDSMNW